MPFQVCINSQYLIVHITIFVQNFPKMNVPTTSEHALLHENLFASSPINWSPERELWKQYLRTYIALS